MPGASKENSGSRGGGEKGESRETLMLEVKHMEERIQRVVEQNTSLLGDLAETTKNLEAEKVRKEDLELRMKTAKHGDVRNKATVQSLQRNLGNRSRTEVQTGADSAQQICELNEVHRRMTHVHQQLEYAVSAQESELHACKDKVAARTRRCRRLEEALYHIVAEAQIRPELRDAVEAGIQKSGPLMQAVLKRGAERLALREVGNPASSSSAENEPGAES